MATSISTVIEVVIGLAFMFATLSLIASGAQELIASAFSLRAMTLEKGIENMLGDPKAAEDVYAHPLIQSLYRPRRKPSYIPPDKFALALLDAKAKAAVDVASAAKDSVKAAIDNIPEVRLRKTLDVLWRDAGEDAAKFRKSVEQWYDSSMERVSGWYRRLAQIILLVLGLFLAVGLNINAITVTQRLWADGPLRAAVDQQAQNAKPLPTTDSTTFKEGLDNVQSGLDTVKGLSLPLGWGPKNAPSLSTWYLAAAGWLLTAIAVSMGAPFWFDLLGKVTKLRSTGDRPAPSTEPTPAQPAAPAT